MKPFYETADELRAAIESFYENPPIRTVIFKGQSMEVHHITTESLARHLGFASRQSLYMLEKKGGEWTKAIEMAKSGIIDHYELQGQHGNSATANFMLGRLLGKAEGEDDAQNAPPSTININVTSPD